MATAGMDSLVKIWDLRMFKCLHSYKTDHPVLSLDISDKGLLAMAVGREVQILQNVAFSKPSDVTYLKHSIKAPGPSLSSGGAASASSRGLASTIAVGCVRFRPFEDVLCAGKKTFFFLSNVYNDDISLVSTLQIRTYTYLFDYINQLFQYTTA